MIQKDINNKLKALNLKKKKDYLSDLIKIFQNKIFTIKREYQSIYYEFYMGLWTLQVIII